MASTTIHEREWLHRLGRGDEAAWVELYRAYQGRIYRFAWQMCGQAGIADEVTQATFVAFLENHRRFDPERGPLLAWLLGIARRQVLNSLRVTHREVGLIEEAAEMVPDGAPLAWEEGDVPALRKVVLSLPDPFREALVLCDLQELSYDEAAQVMGCPVGTIRSRLNRARQMLAERMERSSRRVAVRPAATEIEGC